MHRMQVNLAMATATATVLWSRPGSQAVSRWSRQRTHGFQRWDWGSCAQCDAVPTEWPPWDSYKTVGAILHPRRSQPPSS